MSEYEKIKNQLIERKENLLSLLSRFEKSARQKLDKGFEEQAIQRESEEVISSVDISLNNELKQIEKALLRMEKSEYGTCENCGEEISRKRLEAVPYASFCIKCAS